LSFLLGSKVVLDVEQLSNLLWRFALDHIGNSLATKIKQRLDVEVVCGEDDLKEHFLVDLDELSVPFRDVNVSSSGLFGSVVGLGRSRYRVSFVVFAPFEDLSSEKETSRKSTCSCEQKRVRFYLLENTSRDVGKRNRLRVTSNVCKRGAKAVISEKHNRRNMYENNGNTPSIMFLIKTLRSATGFSTSNFSPSLAARRNGR
jgi:hypothetical protein